MTIALAIYSRELHITPQQFIEIVARQFDESFIWWMMMTFGVLPHTNYAVIIEW